MLCNLVIVSYICFHKHMGRILNAYLNMDSCENIFLLKGNSAIQFNYWNDHSEKFKRFTKNRGFDYIPRESFFCQ